MIVELKNIYKDFAQGDIVVNALKDVSFEVNEADFISIMGPSGSGKSTLMNIIGLLDVPTSGIYNFDGRSITDLGDETISSIRNTGIGFIFQSFNLLPRQTALENVELPLIYSKHISRSHRREMAREALIRVGLEDRITFFPTQLSGGQKQRVAIARAIVNNPRIILADEPTGALDTVAGEQILEIFDKLNNEGSTIVMITHEHSVAQKAKKLMTIRDGILSEVSFD